MSLSADGLAWVLDYLRALRAGRLRPYSFCERKARAATRNEQWGPTGAQLRELAAASYAPANLPPLFEVLCARLRCRGAAWRKVYKSLVVLEWLATRGSPAAATRAQGLRFLLEELRSFQFLDPETGTDHGAFLLHGVASGFSVSSGVC
jgi:epsin